MTAVKSWISAVRAFRIGPAARVAVGLTSIMLACLLALDLVWGVLPDETPLVKQVRERTSELLTLQTAGALSSPDPKTLPALLHESLKRETDVRSIGVRRADGALVAQAGDHANLWKPASQSRSDLDNVRVPLQLGDSHWGDVEVSFRPLHKGSVMGWLRDSRVFLVVMLAAFSAVFFSLYLRRVFHYLDPSAVIPERVRKAFDGFTEGVMVVDKDGRIVLANSTFRRWVERAGPNITGQAIQNMPWLRRELPADPREYPWMRAMTQGRPERGDQMSFPMEAGDAVRTVINCAPIQDANGAVRGCVVTFDDVTELERINTQLRAAMADLEQSREKINTQNEELRLLAMRDALTGCYNRRALFERFEELIAKSLADGTPLSCIMTDIDHFKNINDTHGHATGDKVLQAVAKALGSGLRDADVLARYGGEEFCIVLPGVGIDEAAEIAERLRREIESRAGRGIRSAPGVTVTSSFGVMALTPAIAEPATLIDEADKALYVSKKAGRNRVTRGGASRQEGPVLATV
jgi:diguanylate cyclase (GGDEF)-like protein/PAS domain S-box-containing protein